MSTAVKSPSDEVDTAAETNAGRLVTRVALRSVGARRLGVLRSDMLASTQRATTLRDERFVVTWIRSKKG